MVSEEMDTSVLKSSIRDEGTMVMGKHKQTSASGQRPPPWPDDNAHPPVRFLPP